MVGNDQGLAHAVCIAREGSCSTVFRGRVWKAILFQLQTAGIGGVVEMIASHFCQFEAVTLMIDPSSLNYLILYHCALSISCDFTINLLAEPPNKKV